MQLLRPSFLASDSATSEAVIAHAIYNRPKLPHWLVLLQPTSPLRTSADIDTCLERAAKNSGQCISYSEHFERNGAVYVSNTELFLSILCFGPPSSITPDFYTMPLSRSIDIDYPEDLKTASE